MKKLLFAAMAALLIVSGAFAQRSATQTTKPASFQLTVAVTPPNAAIFIDGAQIKGNVATVAQGTHTVTVKAPGFADFTTTVAVNGNMTLPVKLQSAMVQLTIAVTPPNAAIFVDGAQIKGNVATVATGNHAVSAKAPGYVDFNTTVTVNGNMTLPVAMQQAAFPLSVNANVKGAQVLINGAMAGPAPFSTQLAPGSYTVTVQAPGYLAYNESFAHNGPKLINANLQAATFQLSVNVANVKDAQVLLNNAPAGNAPFNTQLAPGTYTVTVQAPGFNPYTESFTHVGPKSINVSLTPAMGTVTIVIPAASINTDMKGGHWSEIQVIIDGVAQKGQTVQVAPGRRLIKVISGGLQVEGFYEIQAGRNYTFEPFMGLNLKQ